MSKDELIDALINAFARCVFDIGSGEDPEIALWQFEARIEELKADVFETEQQAEDITADILKRIGQVKP